MEDCRYATLAYIFSGNKVLLGAKKYGGAKGKLNGFGGKVEKDDKDIFDAVKREIFEETNLVISNPELHGCLIFNQKKQKKKGIVYLFLVKDFSGDVKESDEMSVEWFDIQNIPEERMWESDKYWFRYVLQKRKFEIELVFNSENDLCDEMNIKFVKNVNISPNV